MKLVVKMLMNSLWGKFGEVNELYEKVEVEARDSLDYFNKGYTKLRNKGTRYILGKVTGFKLKRHTHPIWNAYVACMGRHVIYQEMKKIPTEDLVYVDTDGIHFTGDHKDKFKISDEMGDFKVVHENINGLYTKRKVYRLFDKEGNVIETKMAGNTDRASLSNEQLTGEEEFIVKSTYTAKKALRTGNYDKLGTNIKTRKKIDVKEQEIYYPDNWKSYRKDKILMTPEQEIFMN